jgi:hypothetical protein
MKTQQQWRPFVGTDVKGRSYTSIRPIRPSDPGQPPYALITASVTREAGTYHVEVFTYRFREDGIVDTDTQRRIESGLETNLLHARVRAEQAVNRAWAELYVEHRQEVQA